MIAGFLSTKRYTQRTIKYSHYPWIFLLFLHKTWLIVGFLLKIFQIMTLVAKKKNVDVFAFVKGFLSTKQKHGRVRWAPWAVRQAVITVKHNRPSFRPMKYLERCRIKSAATRHHRIGLVEAFTSSVNHYKNSHNWLMTSHTFSALERTFIKRESPNFHPLSEMMASHNTFMQQQKVDRVHRQLCLKNDDQLILQTIWQRNWEF